MIEFMLIITFWTSPQYNDNFVIALGMTERQCQFMLRDYLPHSGNPNVHLACVQQKL